MAQTIVGLDIGASSIKITRLEASFLRFEFLEFTEHTLPANVDLPWEQLATNVLQVLFSDRDASADKVIASIPGRYVSTRLIRLPFSDKKKIDQTLPFEIESLIPIPLESILLDYQILETDPEGSWVLALFTEKELLEKQLSFLREAAIDPHAIIPAPVALANLWKEIGPEEQEPFAIVDMGESETSLAILQNRTLRYGRSWAVGASNLTMDMADSLDISPAQAQEMKEREADLFATPTPGGDSQKEWMADILKKSLDPIVGGIRQSLLSASKTSDLDVQRIYVCGSGSRLKGLRDHLTKELQVEVMPLALQGQVGTVMEERGLDPASAATSLGLAFHGTREMRSSRINLRTGDYTYVSERAELKRQLISGGVMLAILVALTLVLLGLDYRTRSQEYKRVNGLMETMALKTFPELRAMPSGRKRMAAMEERLKEEKREIELFAPLLPDSISVLDILREVTRAVPQDVTIDVRELTIDGNKVRIEADTSTFKAATQISENLLSTGIFSSADILDVKDSTDQSKVKIKLLLQLNKKI